MAAPMQTERTDSEMSESNKTALFLTNTAHVVKLILSYLNARDLNRCATVCKPWSVIVATLKRRRRTKAWTCLLLDEETKTVNDIHEQLKDFIQNLYTEPRVVFMISQSDFCEARVKKTGEGDDEVDFDDYVRSLMPPGCKLLAMSSGGFIGTSRDLKRIYEIEDEQGVAILCLPDYHDVNIVSCDCDGDNIDGNTTYHVEDVRSLLNGPDCGPCQAIITTITEPSVSRKLIADLNRTFPNALVAGGYVDYLISPNPVNTFPYMRSTAICGANVTVASVVIKETINTAAKAEEKIIELKRHNLPEQNSFAFMFACVGRGVGHYGEPSVESAIFKKHFPNTPLIGFFGNGEIGFDFVGRNIGAEEETQSRQRAPPKLHHAYTTILVLVSIT